MAAKIYPAAKERILEIWDYTERTWSVDQADKLFEPEARKLLAGGEAMLWERNHRFASCSDRAPEGPRETSDSSRAPFRALISLRYNRWFRFAAPPANGSQASSLNTGQHPSIALRLYTILGIPQ